MKAEDKAKELIYRYIDEISGDCENGCETIILFNAKKCALICVDEKIKTYRMLFPLLGFDCDIEESKYYIELQQVKQEINKQ